MTALGSISESAVRTGHVRSSNGNVNTAISAALLADNRRPRRSKLIRDNTIGYAMPSI
jgi:hypothetical protein